MYKTRTWIKTSNLNSNTSHRTTYNLNLFNKSNETQDRVSIKSVKCVKKLVNNYTVRR